MKTPALDKQINMILSQGEPNPNDEWSNGKYDKTEVKKYVKRLLEIKMKQAFKAGEDNIKHSSKTLSPIESFEEWLKREGTNPVQDEDKNIYHI